MRIAVLGATGMLGHLQKLRYCIAGGELPVISDTAIAVMSAGQHLSGVRSQAIGCAPQVALEETVSRAYRWFKSQGLC